MGSGASKAGGFRVHSVSPNSPAADAELEPFFDYVVEVYGVPIVNESQSFFSMMKAVEGETVKLLVFNSRTQTVRSVLVTPRPWEGAGLLGAFVQYENIADHQNQALHVLEVTENSQAAYAGLIAQSDYIICTQESVVRDGEEFSNMIRNGGDFKLLVFNSISEQTRWIVLHAEGPTIGCQIGTGLLHRIPLREGSHEWIENVATLDEPPQLVPYTT